MMLNHLLFKVKKKINITNITNACWKCG